MVEYQYVRGLISCSMLKLHLVTIYNPTTRQSFALPEIKSPTWPFELTYSLLGYDPVKNQYKVLCLFNGLRDLGQTCRIYTLGDPKRQWRNIEGFQNRYPIIKEVHIDGRIYYGARILREYFSPVHGTSLTDTTDTVLMSFDARSERFEHVKTPEPLSNMLLDHAWHRPTFVNYGGKLGCICLKNDAEMWVMENAEKQERSKRNVVRSFILSQVRLFTISRAKELACGRTSLKKMLDESCRRTYCILANLKNYSKLHGCDTIRPDFDFVDAQISKALNTQRIIVILQQSDS